MAKRDQQRSKVYKWEQEVRSKYTDPRLSYDNIQCVIDYVWEQEGLKYPPKVAELHKNTKNFAGTGCRNQVRFPKDKSTRTSVVLHELAHSMTMDFDHESGNDHAHDEVFVGNYMRLLERYMNIPMPVLMYSAQKHRVSFDMFAKPTI